MVIYDITPWPDPKTAPPNRALLQTTSERTTLLYRNGREQRVLEKVAGKRVAGRNELDTIGIFGPILRFVLDDVRRGNIKLMWARWERTDQGTLAVFRYNVRGEDPGMASFIAVLWTGRASKCDRTGTANWQSILRPEQFFASPWSPGRDGFAIPT
jgi:hypothetical protein